MLDRMQLEHDAHTTLTDEILGAIIVPEARPRDVCGRCAGAGTISLADGLPIVSAELAGRGLEDGPKEGCPDCGGSGKVPLKHSWPGLDRPLQERADWWKQKGILKNPDDRYTYYYAIAKQCRPTIIAEVGVFYGYSLMAMAKGAIAGGVINQPGTNVTVNGFDNEQYAPGCLEWARQGFLDERIACNLMHCDTQKMDSFPLSMVQLASIDGDHTYESCMHDLMLMERCMVPRPRLDAVFIVDDIGWALSLRQAAADFAREHGYSMLLLPTHKGTAVLERV